MRDVLSRLFCALALLAIVAGVAQAASEKKLVKKAECTPDQVRFIADVDLTPDGEIIVLDADTKRAMVFAPNGSFLRFLDAFPGIPPEETNVNRLVALPDGGAVIADDEGDRFFFYGPGLKRDRVVPFGVNLVNVNGFVRLPSGELWVAAYGADGSAADKVVHRFSAEGRYLGSSVQAADMPNNDIQRAGMNTGFLAVDPSDATVWFSRLIPFEIVHLGSDGTILGTIVSADRECTVPSPEKVGPGLLLLRSDFTGSCGIAVLGDFLVVSYILEGGRVLADVLTKDGTPITQGITREDPRTLMKSLPGSLLVRHDNSTRRVEVWEETR